MANVLVLSKQIIVAFTWFLVLDSVKVKIFLKFCIIIEGFAVLKLPTVSLNLNFSSWQIELSVEFYYETMGLSCTPQVAFLKIREGSRSEQ